MPEEPQKSPEENITDIIVKVLMAGGITTGGGYAFSHLQKDEIKEAFFSLLIGFGVSCGFALILPVTKRIQKWFGRAGEIVDEGMVNAGQAVVAKAFSMEDRYFEAQATVCELLKTEGVGKVSGLRNNLMLEKVFVPLELNLTMSAVGLRCDETLLEQQENITKRESYFTDDIWQILQKSKRNKLYRQVAVLAWGGYGKTTLLRHIAYRLGTNKQPDNVFRFIPVLLLLRQYRDLITTENSIDLPTVIEQHHLPNIQQSGKELRMPANWAENQLVKGNILVMLDGFDEVPKEKRSLVAKWLNIQMQRYPKSVFILTSRPKAYTEQDQQNSLDLYSTFYIREFNEVQRCEFVKKWYWCQEYYDYGQDSAAIQIEAQKGTDGLIQQIEQRKELRDLASNPLLLTMIARFHRRYPSAELPKRRAELYQEICTLQLKDRPNARELETLLVNCEAQVILQMLALEMMQRKEERIEQRDLLKRLAQYLEEQGENLNPKEFLRQIEQISELLVEKEPEEFEFSHLSFQEFLAAMEVIRLEQEDIFYEHFLEDWWKQTILLYVGKVRKPSQLIRAARQAGATELAYNCMQETTKRIDDDLRQDLAELINLQSEQSEVTAERYQKLEELLIAKEWKDADYETYRLMITAVGKDEGQGFSEKDLKEFPCDELLAIDQLWVKHSNGLYGFSVQKDIYVKCGGKLDFSIPSNDVYLKFYEAIAWREAGEWKVEWNEILDTKRMGVYGHLPHYVLYTRRSFALTFSRIVSCEV